MPALIAACRPVEEHRNTQMNAETVTTTGNPGAVPAATGILAPNTPQAVIPAGRLETILPGSLLPLQQALPERELSEWAPPVQVMYIEHKRDTILFLETGTVLFVPANAFVRSDASPLKGPVVLGLREYKHAPAYWSAMLSTRTPNEILETGGMFYIEASNDGVTCDLIPGHEIGLRTPAKSFFPDMALFEGRRSEQGDIAWQPVDGKVRYDTLWDNEYPFAPWCAEDKPRIQVRLARVWNHKSELVPIRSDTSCPKGYIPLHNRWIHNSIGRVSDTALMKKFRLSCEVSCDLTGAVIAPVKLRLPSTRYCRGLGSNCPLDYEQVLTGMVAEWVEKREWYARSCSLELRVFVHQSDRNYVETYFPENKPRLQVRKTTFALLDSRRPVTYRKSYWESSIPKTGWFNIDRLLKSPASLALWKPFLISLPDSLQVHYAVAFVDQEVFLIGIADKGYIRLQRLPPGHRVMVLTMSAQGDSAPAYAIAKGRTGQSLALKPVGKVDALKQLEALHRTR